MAFLSTLFNWLGHAKAAQRHFADIAEFRAYVISILVKQPGVNSAVPDSSDPAKFSITVGGTSGTADLTNIFGYISAYPDEDADAVIGRFIRSVVQVGAGDVEDNHIVAVLRTREYIDYFKEKGLIILFEPLGADLMITYMADRPDAMSPISSKDVPGKDLQTLRKIALANMRQWLPKVVADNRFQRSALYFVQDNTMLSPSLILLDEFWTSIATRFPGDVLIAIPRKDQLFVFDDGDPAVKAGARRLIDVTIHDDFNLLSPQLYARRGGKIVAVTD